MNKVLKLSSVAGLLRVAVGAVFTFSGLLKIINSDLFSAALASYGLFSPAVIEVLSLLVPHLEITIGSLFAIGLKTKLAGSLVVIQLVIFSIPGAIAYAEGRAIDCGCFPLPGSVEPIGPGFFARNGVLVLSSLWILHRLRRQEAGSAT